MPRRASAGPSVRIRKSRTKMVRGRCLVQRSLEEYSGGCAVFHFQPGKLLICGMTSVINIEVVSLSHPLFLACYLRISSRFPFTVSNSLKVRGTLSLPV